MEHEECRALWIMQERRCALRAEPLNALRDGEVLVDSLFGAISRGTEALVFEGRVPDDEYDRMRAPHQQGAFGFPVKYGYATVGVVRKRGAALHGATVFCLHPHQDRFVVQASDVVPLPEGVPAARGVLAANMETALNVVWDAGILPGDRVAVVGAGLVGSLCAWIASRIPAAEVALVDIDERRAKVAKGLGVAFRSPEDAPRDCDVVIHASASEAGLATAISSAGDEALVVEASWFGEGTVTVPLGGAFHSRRLSLAASQVGRTPPSRRARWPNRRRLETALTLLREDALDSLISGETRFADLPDAYAGILADPATLCHRIRYA